MKIKNGDQVYYINTESGEIAIGIVKVVIHDNHIVISNGTGRFNCYLSTDKSCWTAGMGTIKLFTKDEDAHYESKAIKAKLKILNKIGELPLSKLELMVKELED